jgi:hypothetical protein
MPLSSVRVEHDRPVRRGPKACRGIRAPIEIGIGAVLLRWPSPVCPRRIRPRAVSRLFPAQRCGAGAMRLDDGVPSPRYHAAQGHCTTSFHSWSKPFSKPGKNRFEKIGFQSGTAVWRGARRSATRDLHERVCEWYQNGTRAKAVPLIPAPRFSSTNAAHRARHRTKTVLPAGRVPRTWLAGMRICAVSLRFFGRRWRGAALARGSQWDYTRPLKPKGLARAD